MSEQKRTEEQAANLDIAISRLEELDARAEHFPYFDNDDEDLQNGDIEFYDSSEAIEHALSQPAGDKLTWDEITHFHMGAWECGTSACAGGSLSCIPEFQDLLAIEAFFDPRFTLSTEARFGKYPYVFSKILGIEEHKLFERFKVKGNEEQTLREFIEFLKQERGTT